MKIDLKKPTLPSLSAPGFPRYSIRNGPRNIGIWQTLMTPVTMQAIAHALREVLKHR